MRHIPNMKIRQIEYEAGLFELNSVENKMHIPGYLFIFANTEIYVKYYKTH